MKPCSFARGQRMRKPKPRTPRKIAARMIIGIIQYVAGKKYLTPVSETGKTVQTKIVESTKDVTNARFTAQDWGRIAAASILTLFALMFWAGFEQAGSSLNLFADRATRLVFAGFSYPSSWFQSVEPLFVIIFSPIFALIWLRLGRMEPSSPTKFTLGLAFLSLSFLLIVPAARYYEHTKVAVSPMWLIGLYFLQMCGELCLSPVGLSMRRNRSRFSPADRVRYGDSDPGSVSVPRAVRISSADDESTYARPFLMRCSAYSYS